MKCKSDFSEDENKLIKNNDLFIKINFFQDKLLEEKLSCLIYFKENEKFSYKTFVDDAMICYIYQNYLIKSWIIRGYKEFYSAYQVMMIKNE